MKLETVNGAFYGDKITLIRPRRGFSVISLGANPARGHKCGALKQICVDRMLLQLRLPWAAC